MSAPVLRCTLGDLDVTEVLLRLPLRGAWVAHLELGGTEAPTGAAALRLAREDGSIDTFEGTIRRASVAAGSALVSVTLVGGAGRLLEVLEPREHAQGAAPVPAGLIARSIVDGAGERLTDGVEDALDAVLLSRWTRAAMPAGSAIDVLAWALGMGWRVLVDGSIWIGAETWPAVDASDLAPNGDPRDGSVMYAPEGAPLRPGTTIDGARAALLDYTITPGRSRVRVGASVAGDPVHVPDLLLYRASYAGEVKTQALDGRLDVVPDDPRLPQLLGVPLRLGIPGATATVPAGTRVRVAFEGADPRGAYASALDMDADASAAFALVGDDVSIGYLTGTAPPGGGPVALTISPAPPVTGLPVLLSGKVSGPGHRYLVGVPR